MNIKKVLPVIVFVFLAILAIGLRRCNAPSKTASTSNTTNQRNTPAAEKKIAGERVKFDRNTSELFFTKHAKCRMQCRHISQQEVKDILANGTINYSKSDLNDPQGPSYALEGTTRDRQHVRIIFAPKQRHMSVVTVIDLDNDYQCDC